MKNGAKTHAGSGDRKADAESLIRKDESPALQTDNSAQSRRPDGYWASKDGLEEARKTVGDFKEKNGRMPHPDELVKLVDSFVRAQYRQGRKLGEIKVLLGYDAESMKSRIQYSCWTTPEGVEKAQNIVHDFREQNGRMPSSAELKIIMPAFLNAQHRQGKNIYEIAMLLGYDKSQIASRKPNGYWTTNEGIEEARKTVHDFKEKKGRMPSSTELETLVNSFFFVHYRRGLRFGEIKALLGYDAD